MADQPAHPDGQAADAPPPKSKKKLVILAGVVVLLLAGVGGFLATRNHEPTPSEKLKALLEKLPECETSSDSRIEAKKVLDDLIKLQYVEPDFTGAIPFIKGMFAFYEARGLISEDQQPHLLKAIEAFEDARLRIVPEDRQPQLTYALGVSLQLVGLRTQARPELEEAYDEYPPGKREVGLLLVASYLEEQVPATLEKVLSLSEELQKDSELNEDQTEQLTIQRAQALQLLGRTEEAEQLLAANASPTGTTHEATLIRAKALMAEAESLQKAQDGRKSEAKWTEARELLNTLFKPLVPDGVVVRALFLTARCEAQLRNTDRAIDIYDQVKRKFPASHEGLASTIEMATLLRQMGRAEEALSNYRAALRSIRRPEDFCNRWLTRKEFQKAILEPWTDWVAQSEFEDALEIASNMTPLFDHLRSRELIAETQQKWVESVQKQYDAATVEKRRSIAPELHARWTACGAAQQELAHVVRFTNRYDEIVWRTVDCYTKGMQFQKAIDQIDEYLRSAPKQGVPRAHVQRGQLLSHLDRGTEALEDFDFVTKFYPTDPAVFEAYLWIGHTRLEQNKLAEAEKAWRTLLSLPELDPKAKEWRQAKFSLSRLLLEVATNDFQKQQQLDAATLTDAQKEARAATFRVFHEVVRHLDEYVRRYPNGENRFEARQLLARALRVAASEPREQLQSPLPASARVQLNKEIARLLTRAVSELRLLQDELQTLQTTGRLDELGQQLFRDTFVSIPDVLFEQELYEDAIDEYRTVTNRFPDHPMMVTAYIQMARCYERLGKSSDALEQFEQAKLSLDRLAEDVFRNTSHTREEWSAWLDWAAKVRS